MNNETQLADRIADALLRKAGVQTTPGTVGESGADPQTNRNIYQRAKDAVRYVIGNVTPQTWFTPNQPLLPISQESGGRAWDYPTGFNLRATPRQDYAVGFSELRGLGDGYDLLRLLIETRKDQLAKIEWAIVPVDAKKARDVDNDPRVDEVESFLRMPDRRHTWQQWLRMLTEEMLVIDAATILPRMTYGGKPYSLDLIDGSTINPKIDAFGRPPEAPDVAYQQIIKGVPAADFSLDQLIYMPRNRRVNRVYGYSPVEQIIMTVSIALRRQIHQLQFYTEGSIPDLIMTVPAGWTPAQIKEFDNNWNTMLRGDTATRRGAKWVPADTKSINTKEGALKDEYDEWLARVCCFAFSINPQPFVKQMNRATAETAQQAAMQEGLVPLMQWVEDLMNIILWRYFGYVDLCFKWQDEEEIDPAVQSEIDDRNIKNGSASVDEIRIKRGDEPIGMGPAIYTQNGPVLVKDLLAERVGPVADAAQKQESAKQMAEARATMQPGAADGPQDGQDDAGQPLQAKVGGKKAANDPKAQRANGAVEKLAKAGKAPQALGYDRPTLSAIRTDYEDDVYGRLQKMAVAYAAAVHDAMKGMAPVGKLAKAADWGDDDLTPAENEAARILGKVEVQGWTEFANASAAAIEKAVGDGGLAAYANVAVGQPDLDMVAQIDGRAVEYAQARSAEMVGMVRKADGSLEPNPNPAWSIPDSTRTMLRGTVAQAVEGGWSHQQLKKAIQDDYAFSPARSKMIARTEINAASAQGNLAGYHAAGVPFKRWILGDLHTLSDPCNANAQDGVVAIDEPFSSGDMWTPQHPNCICAVLPVFERPASED